MVEVEVPYNEDRLYEVEVYKKAIYSVYTGMGWILIEAVVLAVSLLFFVVYVEDEEWFLYTHDFDDLEIRILTEIVLRCELNARLFPDICHNLWSCG